MTTEENDGRCYEIFIPVDARTDFYRWFCEALGTKRKNLLPPETQKLFLAKDFVTFQFSKLTQEQEEDLFARVQMGVQLSAAEKMRARSGPWQELAKLFVEDFPMIYGLMKDQSRGKDFQITLACFSQILEAGGSVFKANHNALTKLLDSAEGVNDATKSHFAGVWKTFSELVELDPDIFTNANKYLTTVQTFAPIEMVGVTVLISTYPERSHKLLWGDIKALRETLRKHFTDLRLNQKVWKVTWEFIHKLQATRGAADGSTVERVPVSTALNRPSLPAPVSPMGSKKRAASQSFSKATLSPTELAVVPSGSLFKRHQGVQPSNNDPVNSSNSKMISSIPNHSLGMSPMRLKDPGSFAPVHTEEEMTGVIVPASSQPPSAPGSHALEQPVPPSLSTPRARPNPNAVRRMPVSRPTKEQRNGVIDLTSDTE
jgi:hypothetical protein